MFPTIDKPHGSNDKSEKVLWEFVPLDNYDLPHYPGTTVALEKWATIKRTFKRAFKPKPVERGAQPLHQTEGNLQAPSELHLQDLIAAIDWADAANALQLALSDWLEKKQPDPPVRFVVGPPYSGLDDTLLKLADTRDARRIEAPTAEQILEGGTSWLADWPGADRLWVLPGLQRCYLRHADGLKLIRRLLEAGLDGSLGYGLIGCDSWAWAYWQRLWPMPRMETLVLQAFDGRRLAYLFSRLSCCSSSGTVQVRSAKTGQSVFFSETEEEIAPEFSQLAADCRGNAGLSWHNWRDRLRTLPGDRENPLVLAIEANSESDVVWVSDMVHEPVLPSEKSEDIAHVLHCLLLHGGLTLTNLSDLLPLPRHHLMSLLSRLQDYNVVKRADALWSVTARGYPLVRGFLERQGYLTDDF